MHVATIAHTRAPTPREIRARFAGDAYVAYHAPRYALALHLAAEHAGEGAALDVGPTHLTTLLSESLRRPIDTLGLGGPVVDAGGEHTEYDLTRTADRGSWPAIGPYALIVFAEVIEHLPTAPQHVLSFLRSIMQPRGVLLLQTPNAAALHKRLKLLAGRNPYHLINAVGGASSAHFREYTSAELQRELAGAGFKVEFAAARSYFDYARRPSAAGNSWARLIGGAAGVGFRALPASLRPGYTFVCRSLA